MNRESRRAAKRNPTLRRLAEQRRERRRREEARRIIEARRLAGLTEEAYEALDPEARRYIEELERRSV